MASNLSTIGFAFASSQDFHDTMLQLVGDACEYHACPPGEYAIWRSRSGAEIWFHLEPPGHDAGEERNIAGLTPFYEGGRATQLVLTSQVLRTGDNRFEGAYQAQVGGTGEDHGYPLVFDAVNFSAHAHLRLPARRGVHLAGFARELKAYPGEAEYYAAQTREPVFAAQSFVPIGMFVADDAEGGEPGPPSSHAALTGRVLDARLLENEATGRRFHWLTVESLAIPIDIVADPEIVAGEIAVGATVEVICMLFGRIMDPQH